MTPSEKDKPEKFDDLEPLPPEAELTELPELPAEAELAELPMEATIVEEPKVEILELPDDAIEIAELPGDVEEIPVEKAKPAPKPVPAVKPAPVAKPAPKPAPKPVPVAKPVPAPQPDKTPAEMATEATKPPIAVAPAEIKVVAEAPKPVKSSSGGSRRERMDKEKQERKSKTKVDHWVRWPGPGEKPSREMEQAPALLKKAALGLLIGCLLPWGGYTTSWMGNIGEKLIVLAGLYIWHQSHLLRDGAKVPGFVKSLGAKSFLPLFVMAGILTLAGFLPIFSMASLSGDAVKENLGPFAEKGFLILAGLTMTHIYDYSRGGKFNPMFPIMFLAPGIAGVMAILKVFSADPIGIGHILGGLGAVAVGAAGWMSAYTMYVAMKEAKEHGDAKKKAQAEARKEARAKRKR